METLICEYHMYVSMSMYDSIPKTVLLVGSLVTWLSSDVTL
jgi:hypothetical protein